MIETSQLQTLVAVAKEKSFSRAAEKLQVTQSAISQSMRGLEKKVGVSLVSRVGKKIILTPEGEKLFNLAEHFLQSLDETVADLSHDKSEMSGRVQIGTLNGVGKSWLAPTLLEFAKNNPDLEILISMGFQEDLVRNFEDRLIDFLVLPEGTLPESGKRVFLSDERSTLVFPNKDNFKIKKDITLDELSALPTVLFEQNDHLYFKWCREHFGKVPSNINVRYTVNSHGNMLQAVSQGIGVAVIPTHVLNRSIHKFDVLTLGSKFEVSNYKFYVTYHEDLMEMKRMRETLDRLTAETNPLVTAPKQ